mmetsp:Transcript_7941/g.23665  ORF Transcript_7941/g.23665 Transcript_7941/m.23665 type:complete len:263 (-) Transcript_7941:1668-2456(-)
MTVAIGSTMLVPRMEWAAPTAFSRGGTTRSKYLKLSTTAMAARFAAGDAVRSFSSRMVFTSSPVLILTGHFSWHMPSAAHMSRPAYSYSARMASSRALSASSSPPSRSRRDRRLISRHVVMRWRGVSAASRDGQLDSQKPHSMHASTRSCASGDGLRFFLCTWGSWFRRTPGLRMKSGSKRALRRHMSAYARAPHSISTNALTLRPVPCSPLREPWYLMATISHISCIILANWSTSSASRKPWEKTRCMLPSIAWPKTDASA